MSDATLRPGAERRQQMRQQRLQERLLNLWRLLVFAALATGLGYTLLRQGWILRSPSQVEVSGSRVVSRDQVIRAADLQFPEPLLTLQPQELARTLAAALPVENVRVSRLMLPPRIRIELKDRTAVARAERQGAKGREQGYVDRLGNWINPGQSLVLPESERLSTKVLGWNERHRPALARVLAQRGPFGTSLLQIRFDPAGTLWLDTAELGALRLGPPDGQLERRLAAAAHLSHALPTRLKGQKPQMVDLSDPEQPELTLSGLKGGELPTPATAVKPRGGQ